MTRVCRVWGVARAGIFRGRRRRCIRPAATSAGAVGGDLRAASSRRSEQVSPTAPFMARTTAQVPISARDRQTGFRTSKCARDRRPRATNVLAGRKSAGESVPSGPGRHEAAPSCPRGLDPLWGPMTQPYCRGWSGRGVFRRRSLLGDIVGIHAALHGTRHEALEPVRQGVTEHFGGVEKDAARV